MGVWKGVSRDLGPNVILIFGTIRSNAPSDSLGGITVRHPSVHLKLLDDLFCYVMAF